MVTVGWHLSFWFITLSLKLKISLQSLVVGFSNPVYILWLLFLLLLYLQIPIWQKKIAERQTLNRGKLAIQQNPERARYTGTILRDQRIINEPNIKCPFISFQPYLFFVPFSAQYYKLASDAFGVLPQLEGRLERQIFLNIYFFGEIDLCPFGIDSLGW